MAHDVYFSFSFFFLRIWTNIFIKICFTSLFAINKYTIRLTFSFFFIHHYFQNQKLKFENCRYAFKMSSDCKIHVSRRVCVFFSRQPVATLRLKNRANHVPSIPHASRQPVATLRLKNRANHVPSIPHASYMLSIFALFDWLKCHKE